jgi:adenosine 3'-phospho 5'-phosphosulfate transporter B2
VSIKLNFENSAFLLCFSAGGCQWRLLRLILTGTTSEIVAETDGSVSGTVRPSNSESKSLYQKAISLCYCCVGLQVSYLLWGILQEKIMTR